ncbi:MAG TPA: response regulator [Pyrinomonadaceae bacterium]|nr:response regulator [Pyrinomonadaceae bacterium]
MRQAQRGRQDVSRHQPTDENYERACGAVAHIGVRSRAADGRARYRVLLANDGTEALALYAQHGGEIGAVLTDMMMPFMDGLATIRALKRLNPQIKIIAASGLTANGRSAEAAGVGVNAFLPKPYTAERLLTALTEILRAG